MFKMSNVFMLKYLYEYLFQIHRKRFLALYDFLFFLFLRQVLNYTRVQKWRIGHGYTYIKNAL